MACGLQASNVRWRTDSRPKDKCNGISKALQERPASERPWPSAGTRAKRIAHSFTHRKLQHANEDSDKARGIHREDEASTRRLEHQDERVGSQDKEAKADAREKYKAEVAKLRHQSELAAAKLNELTAAGEDTWEKMVDDEKCGTPSPVRSTTFSPSSERVGVPVPAVLIGAGIPPIFLNAQGGGCGCQGTG
ncbi:MAG: hypothetical protein V9G23_02545 [Giesbergeria sp.]